VASSTLGRWPLLGGRRFARAAIPRPGIGHDGSQVALAIGDYLFGLDDQPAPAELAVSRIPDGDFRWTLTWRTDVIVARDGTEQRIATLTYPRQQFEGSFLLDVADTRTVRQFLHAAPDGTYELPLAHEAVAATAEVTGGTLFISSAAAALSDWIAPGRRVYVRGPAGDAYTTSITGSSGGTINVSSSPPVGGRFPAGLTLIFPIEQIRLENGQGLARYRVNLARWNFSGRSATRAQPGAGAPAATTFDGYRVLDRRPFQEQTVEEVVDGGVEFLDNGATMTSDTSWGRGKLRRLGTWRIDSPSDRQWMKAFLTERRGKWTPFLFPTWQPDLATYEQPTAGAAFIRVTTDYIAKWYPSLAHRRLQIEYADRSVTHHYVHSTSQASGYQELTLVPTLANPIPTGGVTRVSFLETARLDTDEATFEYGSGWKAKVSLPSIVVQESKARAFAWPETAAKARAAFGYGTWAHAWKLDEQLGTVADSIGNVTLSPTGAPEHRLAGALAGDFAVRFNAAGENFIAADGNLFNITTTGQVAIYACIKHTIAATSYLLGKESGTKFWLLAVDTGQARFTVYDGTTVFASAILVDHGDGQWHDYLITFDRDVEQKIKLVTDLGVGPDTNIAAAASISNPANPFQLGRSATANADMCFAAVATAGVPEIRANATAAVSNIRRYTGRI